jgi:RND family efflux transporter MFP subunit
VTSQNQATLHFQTGGKLVSLPFKEGDSVSAGQAIASLDSYTVQKQLTAALNTYRSTRDSFDQTQQNQGNNVIQNQQQKLTANSDTDYLNQVAKRIVDQNQANLDNSVIQVELANYAIQLSTITSPINGIITHLDVTEPQVNVTPLTSFVVEDPSSLVFRANVSENDIDFVSEGGKATVTLGSRKEFSGTVLKIYPDKVTLPSGEHVYQVDIASSDLLQNSKLGQSGSVILVSNTQNQVKLVPTWTVLNNDSVWVMDNGKAVLKQVTVGKIHGDKTEIVSGLKETDQVILDPESIASSQYKLL